MSISATVPPPKPKGDRKFSDAQLYAEFNNALFQSIQKPNTVLERAFRRAFPGFQMSKDLDDFFRTMKITQGWKQ